MRIWRSVSRSSCSFCRFTEILTSGNTPIVKIVSTVIVITSSISEKPLCSFICFITRLSKAKGTKSTGQTLRFLCLFASEHLLLDRCNNSLNDLRLHIARVSGHQLQRFLHDHERSSTLADGLQVNKQERPGPPERCLAIQTGYRDQTRP